MAVLLVAVLSGTPALGQETLPPVVINPDSVVVHAGAPGSLTVVDAPRRGGGGPVIRCMWHELVFHPDGSVTSRPVHPVEGKGFVIWCWFPDDSVVAGYPVLVVYDPADPVPGAAVAAEDAARFALARIDFERPGPELSPRGRQIPGVPTWLGVTSQLDYDPVTAQAGPVWATVRPVLRHVSWDTGDGTTVVCTTDAATTWSVGGSPQQSSACTHVYERSSGHEPHRVVATASWTILWRNDRDPTGWRVFDTLSISTTIAVEVAALQAAIR